LKYKFSKKEYIYKSFFLLFYNRRVVLATGFIHILPNAMQALTDPCLGTSWNEYSAYAGLFAMLSTLGMQLIEFLANQHYRSMGLRHAHSITDIDVKDCIRNGHTHDKADESINKKPTNNESDKTTDVEHVNYENEEPENEKHVHETIDDIKNIEPTNDKIEEPEQMQQTSDRTETPKKKKKTHKKNNKSESMEEADNQIQVPEKKDQTDFVAIEIQNGEPASATIDHCDGPGHSHGAVFQNANEQHKISAYLLELGIALHSVLIGLALGTTTNSFVVLFIAICFHQFFEAVALGTQIASIKNASIRSAIFMIVFYSLTTPVGIAAGIGVHSGAYNPESVSALLSNGILDALAGGILIYVALVSLLTAEMGANAHAFHALSARLKFLYFIALYLGAGAMALIGRWA
jgi:ZIP zinc/iron transport family